jgi:hypothetical protein
MGSLGIWKLFQFIWVLVDIQIILHVCIYVPDYNPEIYITFLHYHCYWVGHICTFLCFPFTSYLTCSREQDCAPILDTAEGRLLSDVHWSIIHILGLPVYTLAAQMFLLSWIKKKKQARVKLCDHETNTGRTILEHSAMSVLCIKPTFQ